VDVEETAAAVTSVIGLGASGPPFPPVLLGGGLVESLPQAAAVMEAAMRARAAAARRVANMLMGVTQSTVTKKCGGRIVEILTPLKWYA